MIIFLIIFVSVFPEIKDKAMDTARKQMEEKQGMSQEQMDAGLGFVKKSFLLFIIIGSIFIYLVAGVISALIGAAVTKKNPQTPFQNQP
jgi:cytochrome bd-type quinol oxidase subunit 2